MKELNAIVFDKVKYERELYDFERKNADLIGDTKTLLLILNVFTSSLSMNCWHRSKHNHPDFDNNTQTALKTNVFKAVCAKNTEENCRIAI